jgi:NADH-ubiquinone oxidoreductase chain 4
MMLAHGLVSSGLFMSSSVIYWRFHSRLIKYFKGLAFYMPIFSILVFILILGNISFPLTLNFISELISLIAAIKLSLTLGILCCLGSFFGVIYSFYLYNRVFFGQTNNLISIPRELSIIEFNSFTPLIILTLIFGILPNFIINIINLSSFINISL